MTWTIVAEAEALFTEKKVFALGPGRGPLGIRSLVPDVHADQEFGAIVEVVADAPMIVERALRNNSGGVLFAAGTASPAVRLP